MLTFQMKTCCSALKKSWVLNSSKDCTGRDFFSKDTGSWPCAGPLTSRRLREEISSELLMDFVIIHDWRIFCFTFFFLSYEFQHQSTFVFRSQAWVVIAFFPLVITPESVLLPPQMGRTCGPGYFSTWPSLAAISFFLI